VLEIVIRRWYKLLTVACLPFLLVSAAATAPGGDRTTLIFADGSEPIGLYPPPSVGPPGTLFFLLYDPLVGHNAKMEPDPRFGLATSWETAPDKLTWTFHLRKGVKFHDGTDFDANAVKVSLDSILDPATGAYRRAVFLIIKEVRVVDPSTVQIMTAQPFPDLPFLLMDQSAGIVSPTGLKREGVADFNHHPAGTGPYKFVEWVPNDHITFVANPTYWRGRPKMARIIYRQVPEGSARTAMLRTGEIDIALNVAPSDLAALRSDPNVTVVQRDSVVQVTSEMRQSKPPFSLKPVRQAMNYAIDKEGIIKNIMYGAGRVADSPGLSGEWGYVALKPYTYDPNKAKVLLAEAGYPNGFEGNLFYVPGRWAGDEQVVEAMQANWAAVGIKINLHKTDNPGLGDYLQRDPNQMAGWTSMQIRSSAYLDFHLYRLFTCTATSTPQSDSRSGYCDSKVDDLITKGRSTFDFNQRKRYYADAERTIWDDAPFIWLFVRANLLGTRKGVTGYDYLPIGDLRLTAVTK
jgi:peptide/nickel transport system substrate-binding protein